MTFAEVTEPITDARDALNVVGLAHGADTDRVLLDGKLLPAAFFDLSSGFAGEFVQKLTNYGIKAAAVIAPGDSRSDNFNAFARESRRGSHFRIYEARDEAEAWLKA